MKIISHQRIDGVIPNARGQRAFPSTALAHFDSFVMNTQEEITQAKRGYEMGLF